MITPMNAPLVLRRNDNPCRVTWVIYDGDTVRDLSGVTARLHVRLYEGAAGAPLISANTGETTESHLVTDVGGVQGVFTKADILALPVGRAGEDVVLHYDLLLTIEGDENAYFYGSVTVPWGVTQ